ncbi:MAG: methyltransferase domain-containing protein [Candidatus Margulisiibacteriota bacterium]
MINFDSKREITELKKYIAYNKKGTNPHLDSNIGLFRYIKDADKIKTFLPQGKILDWGCGLGQMSYFLKNRGFEVVSYDIDQGGREFLSRIGQLLIAAKDPVNLPFPAASFDAVLSSGVLEHVSDPVGSLSEISRVIKKNSYLFVFRLPNKYSYIEFISDCLGHGDHPVKYSVREIKQILKSSGYEVLQIGYRGFIPYNLKGFHPLIRRFYHLLDSLLSMIDAVLTFLPIVNVFSTNIDLVARKK